MPSTKLKESYLDWFHIDGPSPFQALVRHSLAQLAAMPEALQAMRQAHENLVASRDLIVQIKAKLGEDSELSRSVPTPRADGRIEIGTGSLGKFDQNLRSHNLPALGFIQLDPAQIGAFGWLKPDGSWQAENITGTLGHEIFHQADPHLQSALQAAINPQAVKAKAGKLLDAAIEYHANAGMAPEEIHAVKLTIFQAAALIALEEKLPAIRGMNPTDRTAFFSRQDAMTLVPIIAGASQQALDPVFLNAHKDAIAQHVGVPAAQIAFHSIDPLALEIDFDPVTKAPKVEELATQFEDFIMSKYFDQAPRIHYLRALTLPKSAREPMGVHPFKCGTPTELDYHDADPAFLGQLPKADPRSCAEILGKTVSQAK